MFRFDSSLKSGSRLAFAGALLSIAIAGTPRAMAKDDDPNDLPPEKQNLRGQYLKGHVSRHGIFDPSRLSPFAAPAGAHLTYFGGRVVSSMKVVQVLWGTGSYLANVSSTASPSMATFYQGVLNSPYVDWLNGDYNTVSNSNGGIKTNQSIGRGAFVSQVTITPSSANNGATISDAQIQAELAAQIAAGHLPAPTQDAAGNNNTYYAIFFPHGKTITQGGSNSCQAGGFCAYHGTVASSTQHSEFYYGIHPDMQAGSGCDTGCGNAATAFGNYTSVASHEMIETITDAEVGLATVSAPPLAWYDNTNGEIGDICNAQQGSVVGSDGVTYVVQTEFSNSQNNCVVSIAAAANDFSVAVSPASTSIQAGSSGSVTVSTATTSGNAQAVGLSLTGAPSGVTASFSPASVTSGGSATLIIATAASTAPGPYTLTVTGTATSGSHAAAESLTVTAAPVNDFSLSLSSPSVSVVQGGASSVTVNSALVSGSAQSISLSASGLPAGVTASFSPSSVTAGASSTLSFSAAASATPGTATATVQGTALSGAHTVSESITVTSSSPTPPGSGITNGGFETGTLAGWTPTGASESVIGAGCHGGAFCARLGGTTATNGDSTISQTFTAPTGATGLSFWYKETCPDTITYDWALATLKDNTTGTSTAVLPKACATTSWSPVAAALTAGHSYTLSLTSHDDNYTGDPTYTLYDDVVLTNSPPPPPPAPGVTNGGFESGSTGWTTSGTTSIVAAGCHSGAACARAGSTSSTNGDSAFTQTFTVPAGKTQLSVWYKSTCPDTVTYDWAVITLTNNGTHVSTTVLPRSCQTNPSWVNRTAVVTAGQTYTLTLISHDDNYPGDPTFTLFDDITLN